MILIWEHSTKTFRKITLGALAIAKLADRAADLCLERWMRAVYSDDRPLPDTVQELLNGG